MRAVCIAGMIAFAAGRADAVDFLLPGISLGSVSLAEGARVSYLVVAQSFGSSDSSWVELAVLGRSGGEVRLEVSTAAYPPLRADMLTIRLRLAERVIALSSADEFRTCLHEIRIRQGTGKFREPTEAEMDELAIEKMFLPRFEDASQRTLESQTVAVPAGAFSCMGVETGRRDARTVTLGGVSAERIEEEMTRIWLSEQVPFWGLVKSRLERRTTIRRNGSPGGAPRVVVTESVLLSFRKPRLH